MFILNNSESFMKDANWLGIYLLTSHDAEGAGNRSRAEDHRRELREMQAGSTSIWRRAGSRLIVVEGSGDYCGRLLHDSILG